jgi:hypothetical protein
MHFHPKLRINLIAAVALCAHVATAPAATDTGEARNWLPDILGFKLGMPLNEVMSRLNTMNIKPSGVPQRMRSNVGEYTPAFMAVPTALESNDAGIFSFGFSTPPRSDRVVYVNRSVDYAKLAGKAPMASDLEGALVKKFGPPTERHRPTVGDDRLVWIWSPSGQLQNRALGTPCEQLAGRFQSNMPPLIHNQTLKIVQGGCGVVMQALITRASSGVVTNLHHHAIDVAGGVDAWQAMQAAAGEQARQKNQQDADRARQQKPAI